MTRKRMIDRTVPDAGQHLVERYGLEGAQRIASNRGDDARTVATTSFYERVHHWLRTYGPDLAANVRRSAPARPSKKARELKAGDIYSPKGRKGPPRRVSSISQHGVFITVAYAYRVIDSRSPSFRSNSTKWCHQTIPPLEKFHTNKIVELYTDADFDATPVSA